MRRLAVLAALTLAGCATTRPDVKLTFDESGKHVTIATTTEVANDAQRNEIIAGHDEWSYRFQHAAPKRDRVAFDRDENGVTIVQHSATIDADDIQKFFFDVSVTTNVIRDNGWLELSIIPGTSDRETPEQRIEYEKKMHNAAHRVLRYFAAMRALYGYLDKFPDRSDDVFDQLVRDENDMREPLVTKFEMGLIREARHRIEAVQAFDWKTFAADAELVENPFPANIRVRVPGDPLIIEGFERQGDDLIVRPRTLFEVISELEGRWLSPDPLAMGLRVSKIDDIIATIRTAPRHAEPVVGEEEIIAAIRERLHAQPRYRVRFVTRSAEPSS